MNRKRTLSRSLVAAVVAVCLLGGILAGCSGNSSTTTITGSLDSLRSVILGVLAGVNGVTVFPQTIAAQDGDGEVFPGQANHFDLNANMATEDGADDQLDGSYLINVGGTPSGNTVTGGADFPYDQTYGELTFWTPLVGLFEGLKSEAAYDASYRPPITGTWSAALNSTAHSFLRQTVNLTSAVAPVNLAWTDQFFGNVAMIPGQPTNYQVVIRDLSGNLLATAYQTSTGQPLTGRTYNLDAFVGQRVQVCFESDFTSGSQDSTRGQPAAILDDVSVVDNTAAQFINNGTFETGNLLGWLGINRPEPQNVTGGLRTVGGLDVVRSFYTVPNRLWGRQADSYTNNTVAPITTTIYYLTNLGSDNSGIIYFVDNTNNRAIGSFDGSKSDRDVGFVFGNASAVAFTSADPFGSSTGSDDMRWSYDVTVQPGQTITIVNFLILDGIDTGQTATSINDRATAIDAEARAIVSNFRVDPALMDGLTQKQIDTLFNM